MRLRATLSLIDLIPRLSIATQLMTPRLLKATALATYLLLLASSHNGDANAGIVSQAGLYVSGTGVSGFVDNNPIYDEDYYTRLTSWDSISGTLVARDEITSYSDPPDIRTHNSYAEAGSLAGNLSATAGVNGSGSSDAWASIIWHDRVRLLPPAFPVSGEPPILAESLYFNFTIHGWLIAEGTDFLNYGTSGVQSVFNGQILLAANASPAPAGEQADSVRVYFDHDATARLDLQSGDGSFHYSLRADAQSVGRGSAMSSFGETMSLTSVLFGDGSTPESRGYTLLFDSGMDSPNLTAVPEPSSYAAFFMSLVGLIAYRRRRQLNS